MGALADRSAGRSAHYVHQIAITARKTPEQLGVPRAAAVGNLAAGTLSEVDELVDADAPTNEADRKLLGDMYRQARRLPHPY